MQTWFINVNQFQSVQGYNYISDVHNALCNILSKYITLKYILYFKVIRLWVCIYTYFIKTSIISIQATLNIFFLNIFNVGNNSILTTFFFLLFCPFDLCYWLLCSRTAWVSIAKQYDSTQNDAFGLPIISKAQHKGWNIRSWTLPEIYKDMLLK